MEKISRYIGDYYRKVHRTPTVRAIADGVGLSKSAVYNYLREMNDRGMISYEDGVVTDLPKIDKTETGYFSAPLVGSIRCGDPETEEEEVEMYINLPEALFGRGDFYLLRATGDSMVDAGITEGDLKFMMQDLHLSSRKYATYANTYAKRNREFASVLPAFARMPF